MQETRSQHRTEQTSVAMGRTADLRQYKRDFERCFRKIQQQQVGLRCIVPIWAFRTRSLQCICGCGCCDFSKLSERR